MLGLIQGEFYWNLLFDFFLLLFLSLSRVKLVLLPHSLIHSLLSIGDLSFSLHNIVVPSHTYEVLFFITDRFNLFYDIMDLFYF